jgi:hypothetical protein
MAAPGHWSGTCDLFRQENIRMKFQDWWNRAPHMLRFALLLASISAMALGGAADHFWN